MTDVSATLSSPDLAGRRCTVFSPSFQTLLYTHPVHQISFISRDVTDSRAFGYIFGPGDGTHRFFGIKTASAAENLVLALRDLFQTVYEMKKKEMEEAKAKAAAGTQENQEGEADNPDTTYQVPPNGAPVEGQDNIYQVPKNNAPVNPQEQEEAVANLLDLEDQVDNILKGIEQIKNLDFDDLPEEEAPRKATSATTSPTTTDPWGAPATPASGTSSMPTSSSLSDLQTLQAPPVSNPFSTMQAFPGTPAPAVGVTAQGGPFAMGPPGGMGFMAPGQQRMAQPGAGLPVTRDPFGDDPFNTFPGQQRAPAPGAVPAHQPGMPFGARPGFGNPFPMSAAGPVPGQAFPGAMVAPGAAAMPQGYSMPGFAPFGLASPPVMGMGPRSSPQPQQSDPNLLQPLKPGGQEEEAEAPKSPRPPLFEDLVDIKKTSGAASAAKSPKEMFKQLNAPPKKSLNEIKVGGGKSPTPEAGKASDDLELAFAVDPFGPLDAMLDMSSTEADPFDTSHISPPSSPPPPLPPPSLLPPPPAPPDPSTHPVHKKSEPEKEQGDTGSQKESSPEDRFDMPDEPPPPLPSHLQISTSAPAPPPRPPPRDKPEPPVPHRPRPKPRRSASSSSASSINFPLPTSSVATLVSAPEPPLPSSPRPLPRTVSSPPASSTGVSSAVPSAVDTNQLAPCDSGDASTSSSPSVFNAPPSPSHSLDSSLSQASSQKSLSEKTLNPNEEDDPFGVPLRSKKSSSGDAGRKSNRSSAGKSNAVSDAKLGVTKGSNSSLGVSPDPFMASDSKAAVMLDSRLAFSTDPFGMPQPGVSVTSDDFGVTVPDSQEHSVTQVDGFSAFAFNDTTVTTHSNDKWEAFGEGQTNGTSEEYNHQDGKKTVKASSGDWPASPFGDSFLAPSPTPVNGK
ncbi:hypothetical protein BaRGS_00007291, partial [Batillaria attramentaria]